MDDVTCCTVDNAQIWTWISCQKWDMYYSDLFRKDFIPYWIFLKILKILQYLLFHWTKIIFQIALRLYRKDLILKKNWSTLNSWIDIHMTHAFAYIGCQMCLLNGMLFEHNFLVVLERLTCNYWLSIEQELYYQILVSAPYYYFLVV